MSQSRSRSRSRSASRRPNNCGCLRCREPGLRAPGGCLRCRALGVQPGGCLRCRRLLLLGPFTGSAQGPAQEQQRQRAAEEGEESAADSQASTLSVCPYLSTGLREAPASGLVEAPSRRRLHLLSANAELSAHAAWVADWVAVPDPYFGWAWQRRQVLGQAEQGISGAGSASRYRAWRSRSGAGAQAETV